MQLDPVHIVNALWIVLMTVWAVGALQASPAIRRQPIRSRLAYVLLLVAASLLMWRRPFGLLGSRFVPHTEFVGWIGVGVAVVGIAVAIAARVFLGRNWSGVVTVKKDHELIRRGPYAVVRHPIYSGILLGLLGTAIVVGEARALIGVALFAVGFRVKSLTEEQFMEEQFGGEYRDYKSRVKALIPLIW
jgi:protein-S-isoprenylcysteine O-methyltransferase